MRSTQHFAVATDPMMVCPCCGQGQMSVALLILVETVRMHFGVPVTINSTCRCAKHNKKVGGAKNSEHLIREDEDVDAADIVVEGISPTQVYLYLKGLPYANLLGIGKYKTFTHVDTRGYGARW
jgi:uncharacterized protein YcbK (DUF882 family)